MSGRATSSCLARVVAGLWLACASIGCSGGLHRGDERPLGEDPVGPGALLPPDTLGFDFSWHQVVTVAWTNPDGSDQAESFEAVLQGRGGTMQLVGLGPMSQVAFVITHTADGVAYENRSGREFPFEPEYMIADVQRVSFPWGPAPEPGFSGRRRLEVLDVSVEETWDGGHLAERRFARLDAPERGEVVVSYSGWAGGDTASTAVLESGWYGYRLTVRTVSAQRL